MHLFAKCLFSCISVRSALYYTCGNFQSATANSLPGYHPDNKMITGGCAGSGIGIPQRIRVTTWKQTHENYTECVKSERVGMRTHKLETVVYQWFPAFSFCV